MREIFTSGSVGGLAEQSADPTRRFGVDSLEPDTASSTALNRGGHSRMVSRHRFKAVARPPISQRVSGRAGLS